MDKKISVMSLTVLMLNELLLKHYIDEAVYSKAAKAIFLKDEKDESTMNIIPEAV